MASNEVGTHWSFAALRSGVWALVTHPGEANLFQGQVSQLDGGNPVADEKSQVVQ